MATHSGPSELSGSSLFFTVTHGLELGVVRVSQAEPQRPGLEGTHRLCVLPPGELWLDTTLLSLSPCR